MVLVRAPATVQDGAVADGPSFPAPSLAERAREPPVVCRGSTGAWANEGRVSPHTVAPLFQLQKPDTNVTLEMGAGQRQEKGSGQKLMPEKALLPAEGLLACWPPDGSKLQSVLGAQEHSL